MTDYRILPLNETSHSLVEDFLIDDGQLAGMGPAPAFVLGAEYALVVAILREHQEFTTAIHAENTERIELAATRHGMILSLRDRDDGYKNLRAIPARLTKG